MSLNSSLLIKPQKYVTQDPLDLIDNQLADFESDLKAAIKTVTMTDTVISLIPLRDGSLIFATLTGEVFKIDSNFSNAPEKLFTEIKGGKLLMTSDERILIYSGQVPYIIAFRDGQNMN